MPNGQKLSEQELAQLAKEAGFSGDAIRWAVAIAEAESGGNPSAYNPEIAAGTVKNSGSRGLWQIYGQAHPEYNSSLTFDPVVNAKAAFAIYRQAGNKFTPWSTYNNGSAAKIYQGLGNLNINDSGGEANYGNRGRDISGSEGHAGTGPNYNDPLTGAIDQISQTNTALNKIASGQFITEAWGKVDKTSLGFYIAGIILILIGLFVLLAKPATEIAVKAGELATIAS
jgi:lysozyme-like protein